MFWVRIDNRLIHGQIIESWLPYTGAKLLAVADDELADDPLRQEIMTLAIPSDVTPLFMPVEDATAVLRRYVANGGDPWPNAIVLFASCTAARRAYEAGLRFTDLNIGNLHYGPGKRQVLAHVALSGEDESCLKFLEHRGVALDFRCVPNQPVHLHLDSP